MDSTLDTPERLADAALRALARRGLRKLSVTDVCDEAGVARGTLYRYYASREDVLAAAEERIVQGIGEALRAAVAARPAPDERIQTVLDGLEAYLAAHPEVPTLVQDEPAWVREVLGRLFEDLLDAFLAALQPTLERAASVVSRSMSERQLAEVLLRLVLTAATRAGQGSAGRDIALWEALLAPAPARKRAALSKAS